MWPGWEVVNRWSTKQGYVCMVVREIATGRIRRTKEHRWEAGLMPGEPLEVHHDNHVKDDNQPTNLIPATPAEHRHMHPERSAVGGRIGGPRVRDKCLTDSAFREQQVAYGRQSRVSWQQNCAANPILIEQHREWARRGGKTQTPWGKVPPKIKERIYELRDSGMSPGAIARLLTSEDIPTPRQLNSSWGRSTVLKVLAERQVMGEVT